MLKKAERDQLNEIYKHFYNNKEWFPHIRKDYLKRMITSQNVIFDDGIIIIYKKYSRKQKIGKSLYDNSDLVAQKNDVMLHQILNINKGSGKAQKIIKKFFEEMNERVWLSVRSDNLRACKFYENVGMKLLGTTSWSKGKIKGKIYLYNN